MSNRKPLFYRIYFPGLISLIFLPLMCIGYFLYTGKLERLFLMDIVWANDAHIKHLSKVFGQEINIKTLRNFNDQSLIGDKKKDNLILLNLKKNIRKLETVADTVNGYSITFTNKTKYSEVVQTLDICKASDQNKINYAVYNDQVFIWRNSKINEYDCLLCDDVVPYKSPPPTSYERFISEIEKFKTQYVKDGKSLLSLWPSMIFLIIMIALTIKRKTNRLTNSNQS